MRHCWPGQTPLRRSSSSPTLSCMQSCLCAPPPPTPGDMLLCPTHRTHRLLYHELELELGLEAAGDIGLEASSPGAERLVQLPGELARFQVHVAGGGGGAKMDWGWPHQPFNHPPTCLPGPPSTTAPVPPSLTTLHPLPPGPCPISHTPGELGDEPAEGGTKSNLEKKGRPGAGGQEG